MALAQVRQGKGRNPLAHVIRFQAMAEDLMKKDGAFTGLQHDRHFAIQGDTGAVFLILDRFRDAPGQAVQVEFQGLAAPFAHFQLLRLAADLELHGNAELAENGLQFLAPRVLDGAPAAPGAKQQFPFRQAEPVEKVGQKAVVGQYLPRVHGQGGQFRPRFLFSFRRPGRGGFVPGAGFFGPASPAAVETAGQRAASFFQGKFAVAPAVQRELHGLGVLGQLRPEFFHWRYFIRISAEKQK